MSQYFIYLRGIVLVYIHHEYLSKLLLYQQVLVNFFRDTMSQPTESDTTPIRQPISKDNHWHFGHFSELELASMNMAM